MLPEVQLIDAEGENHGTVALETAQEMALDAGLRPCRNFSDKPAAPSARFWILANTNTRLRKRAAEARKKQKTIEVKEIKMRPNIDTHDYDVKMRSVRRFFDDGDKVKITLRFRGREMAHMNLGMDLLKKVKEDTEEIAKGGSRTQTGRPSDDDGSCTQIGLAEFVPDRARAPNGVAPFFVLQCDFNNTRTITHDVKDLQIHQLEQTLRKTTGKSCDRKSLSTSL